MLSLGVVVFAMVDDFSLLDAFYLSCISLATVGYGDISPLSEGADGLDWGGGGGWVRPLSALTCGLAQCARYG